MICKHDCRHRQYKIAMCGKRFQRASSMTSITVLNNSQGLLPVSIIKKSAIKAHLNSAEFHFLDDGSLYMFLLTSQQRILVARKQGDVFRTWKSIDRAVTFIKANFSLATIQVFLASPLDPAPAALSPSSVGAE